MSGENKTERNDNAKWKRPKSWNWKPKNIEFQKIPIQQFFNPLQMKTLWDRQNSSNVCYVHLLLAFPAEWEVHAILLESISLAFLRCIQPSVEKLGPPIERAIIYVLIPREGSLHQWYSIYRLGVLLSGGWYHRYYLSLHMAILDIMNKSSMLLLKNNSFCMCERRRCHFFLK